MALPLSNAAENEDELVHGFDTTGYAELPADHLSDSSESSNGTSCNLPYDTLGISVTSLQPENLATTHHADVVAHIDDSNPLHNGAYAAHINGMEIQAETHNEDVVAHIIVGTPYQNENQGADINININSNSNSNSNILYGNGGHVVHIDGMEVHVYGQLAGLQLSSCTNNSLGIHDDEEDVDDEDVVDESDRQQTEDAAFQREKEADDARRLAPLPPDRCQAIKNAMQSISLGGFQPEWANKVPEEQWVNRLRRKSMPNSIEN